MQVSYTNAFHTTFFSFGECGSIIPLILLQQTFKAIPLNPYLLALNLLLLSWQVALEMCLQPASVPER